jgi:head-tail adaptor
MAANLPAIGELNRRIQIRLRTDVPNASFGIDETYDVGIPRWAKKEPVHSLAIRSGQNTGEEPTDLFWVRWGTGTKPTDFTGGTGCSTASMSMTSTGSLVSLPKTWGPSHEQAR